MVIAELEPILQPGAQNRWDLWVTGFGDFVNVDAERGGGGWSRKALTPRSASESLDIAI